MRLDNGKFACRFCNRIFDKGSSVTGHSGRCKNNPNYKKNCETISKTQSGRKHKEETKRKISESRIKFLKENPDKVPYKLNHYTKRSYPEKLFRNELERRDIKGWIEQYQIGLYSYDFAFPQLKIDIEIDGATHKQDKIKEIDKKRDEYSKSLGWRVFRIPARNLNLDINKVFEDLFEFIGGEDTIRKLNLYVDKRKEINNLKNKIRKRIKWYRKKSNKPEYKLEIKSKIKNKKDKKNIRIKSIEFKEKIDNLKNKRLEILKSIDTSKYGWVGKLAIAWNVSHTQVKRYINKNNIDIRS